MGSIYKNHEMLLGHSVIGSSSCCEIRMRVNLEIGHVDWLSSSRYDSLSKSLTIAREYMAKGNLDRSRCVLTVLIDDKSKSFARKEDWLFHIENHHPEFHNEIDFFVFESSLETLKHTFLSLVVNEHREEITRQMIRYQRRHGIIACSHDIAIWHLYRLGFLGIDLQHVFFAKRHQPPTFFAEHVVSILEETDMPAEMRAQGLLRSLTTPNILSHIELLQYPV